MLFCSFDVLFYLRLSKNIIKVNYWLIAAFVIWLLTLVFHLWAVNNYLIPIKDFVTLSGMVVQLLILYFVGMFFLRRIERSVFPDDIKQSAINALSVVFKTGIFAVILIVHLIFILLWPG